MATIPPGGTLIVGLNFTSSGCSISGGQVSSGGEWQPMDTAPRDGTTIEIRCTYGVAPWYDLFHWIETPFGPRWAKVGDDNSGVEDGGPTLMWRPYAGDAQAYVDPTGGAQSTRAYWLRASGFNPRDYPGSELSFEEEARIERSQVKVGRTPTPRKRGFLERLFSL